MELIQHYFPELHQDQIQKLMDYEALLRDWNTKINLISRKNEADIFEQHILHSLSIAKLIVFDSDAQILDLGTGGGLPGIPLAILFPETKFHLIDSIGKKVNVVNHMIQELHLQNVTAEKTRAEEHHAKYDFVVTRAVAKTQKLLTWTKHLYKKVHTHDLPNGLIALKGGDLTLEVEEINKDYDLIPISTFFEQPFFSTKQLLFVPIK